MNQNIECNCEEMITLKLLWKAFKEALKFIVVTVLIPLVYLQTLDDYEWNCVFETISIFCGKSESSYTVTNYRSVITLIFSLCAFVISYFDKNLKEETLYTTLKEKDPDEDNL